MLTSPSRNRDIITGENLRQECAILGRCSPQARPPGRFVRLSPVLRTSASTTWLARAYTFFAKSRHFCCISSACVLRIVTARGEQKDLKSIYHSALCTLQSALSNLHSAPCTLRFAANHSSNPTSRQQLMTKLPSSLRGI